MSKVNWQAKHEHEFVNNFKLVQRAFAKHSIQQNIDVAKVVKARPLDNIELLQWFHRFYQIRAPEGVPNYDGLYRRKLSGQPMPDWAIGSNRGAQKPKSTNMAPTSNTTLRRVVPAGLPSKTANQPATHMADKDISQLSEENNRLRQDLEEQTIWGTEMDKEREFYYNKLRKIELLLQAGITSLDAEEIKTILYAPFEEEEIEEEDVTVGKQPIGGSAEDNLVVA